MKTSISKRVNHSVYLEETDLQAIHKLLSGKFTHVSITAECSDGSVLETEDMNELLTFENPSYRKINRLTFEARNEWTESCSLDIHRPDVFGRTAEVSVKSENDERALFVFAELLKRLRETKPNYDVITRVPVTFIVFGLWGLTTLTLTFLRLAGLYSLQRVSTPFTLEMFNQIFLASIVLLAITSSLDWGLRRLFPKVFFALGRQKRAIDKIKKTRNFIFVGIALAILIGLLTNYISNKWFN